MRIAIVKLSALGDIVHAMIVLQFIKSAHPDLTIDWFVDEKLKGVLDHNPHINKIQTIRLKEAKKNKSLWLLLKEMAKLRRFKKYDLVIDLQNLIKSAIIANFIPSIKTIGLDKSSSREKLASLFYSQKFKIDHSSNAIRRNIAIINFALSMKVSDEDIINKEPFLFFNTNINFDSLISNKSMILLIPGSSFKAKMYPAERYAEIANKINGNFFVVWGCESERLVAEKIKLLSPQVNVVNRLTFNELKSFISRASLVIGGDTGPVHMAWALGVASITIFGPTPGYRNTYLTNINHIIESKSQVDPYKINKKDLSIRDIDPNDVVKMAVKLIENDFE
jgi:heptosyltransferase I